MYEHTIKEIIRRDIAKRMSERDSTEPGSRVFAVVRVRGGRRSSRTKVDDVISLHEEESVARVAARDLVERDHSLSMTVRRIPFADESPSGEERSGDGEPLVIYRYDETFAGVVDGDPAKALSDSILDAIGKRAGVSR